jgi:hypothetical protein
MESKGSAWEEAQGIVYSTDRRGIVVPGRRHTGHSKQHSLEIKGSAWVETHMVLYTAQTGE